ncbi:E3 ubiquitin-protein ligase RNF14-like [Ruditapes philippinarum]|uniref:E3 ubiquitin-protein ligase RNF14-like n=1 Tax=Ruditapes philippinarum TaxID=129788 RepID=UPI00295BB068|nr:E3 ubiquitin-protein ligase RNF14-like [Ruditapes philippinarum]
MKVFRKSTQECNICFEQNFGHNFFLLPECGHHICKECLGSHCQLLVKEGSVLQISCPMCKAFIPPYILKEVLTEEEFSRFESLSLVKSLETMGDVKWCPRCNSPVIVEPDQGLKLAQCMACFFTFCTDCMDKWHQGEKCKGDEDVSDELPEIDEKDVRRKEYIIKTLEQERQNKHSKMYIRKMTKRCPKCTSPIMKTGGCNKVVCTYCSTSMCYICEKQIDGYKHFADSPKCNTFTFEEDLIDNTDIRQPEHHGFLPINAAAQRVLRNALPNTTGKQINDRLKDNPELRNRSFRCSACKQVNIKETASNHIHCWNCKVSVCFNCKQKITGTVGKHFAGINSCPQHTAI